jgi:hypothetical protein
MAGASLGTNLHALVDWTTAFPFLNLFRQSRPWYTQTEAVFDTGEEGLLDLDPQGWVRAFTRDGSAAPFSRVSTILFTADAGVVTPGTYELVWQGAGDLQLDFVPESAILSRGANRITFRLAQGAIQIAIASTDPEQTGDYIRNIQLYNTDHRELVEAGFQFAPAFLEKIENFRVLRFMDWMNTNLEPPAAVSAMRPGGSARETSYGNERRGAAVETMVALANAVKADPWFTLPHNASDEYITTFATYVRDHLDPDLAARFELSNEVWNFIFPQAQFALEQGAMRFGEDAEARHMQWYGMRAAEMAEIVAAVFGAATGRRALNVFATQSFFPGLEQAALDAPDLVARGGSPPRRGPFHVYAIAPYFGGSLGSEEMAAQVNLWASQGEAGLQQALTWLRTSSAEDSLAEIDKAISYHAGVARRLGWQLEAYEGGQHIVDQTLFFGGETTPARTAFFTELVRHPDLQGLYETYFNLWRDSGGGLMAHFSDFGEPGPYGSWGLWESSTAADTPRARAVIDFRDGQPAWWADRRGAETFANGRVAVGSDGRDRLTGTRLADRLSALGGNNTVVGLAGDDWLAARQGNDRLSGGRGNDTLQGGGGADALLGGPGHDRLLLGGGADSRSPARAEGGPGFDTVALTGAAQRLVPPSGARFSGLEAFDLTGSGANSLHLDLAGLRRMASANWLNAGTAAALGFRSGSHRLPAAEPRLQLLIHGDAGDSFAIQDGSWSNAGTISGTGAFAGSFTVLNSNGGLEQLIVHDAISTGPLPSGGGL